jgi:hypothetical protein
MYNSFCDLELSFVDEKGWAKAKTNADKKSNRVTNNSHFLI